jgi:hypothetical protein
MMVPRTIWTSFAFLLALLALLALPLKASVIQEPAEGSNVLPEALAR